MSAVIIKIKAGEKCIFIHLGCWIDSCYITKSAFLHNQNLWPGPVFNNITGKTTVGARTAHLYGINGNDNYRVAYLNKINQSINQFELKEKQPYFMWF